MALKKRKDGRYVMTATINGKRKFFYGKSRKEVFEKHTEFLRNVDLSAKYNDQILLNAWIDNWLSIKEKTITTQSYLSYEETINRYIRPLLGNLKLCDISSVAIRNTIDSINLSPRTVTYAYTLISAILEQAVIDDLIPKNPAKKVKPPKKRKIKKSVTLTQTDIQRFMAQITDEEIYMIFKLAFATGLRRSEILGLRWADFNPTNNTITVNQTALKTKGLTTLSESTKNKTSRRTISIDDNTATQLKRFKTIIDKRRLQTYGWQNHDLIFPGKKGGARGADNISHLAKKYAQKIGIDGFTFHSIRHTHATLLLEQGVNFKVVQMRLGHSSIKETMDTYAHVTPIMEDNAIQEIEKFFKL